MQHIIQITARDRTNCRPTVLHMTYVIQKWLLLFITNKTYMKNWDPFVSLPLLAIDNKYSLSWFKVKFSSVIRDNKTTQGIAKKCMNINQILKLPYINQSVYVTQIQLNKLTKSRAYIVIWHCIPLGFSTILTNTLH